MNDRSSSQPGDSTPDLDEALKREASAQRPVFSQPLHERIMTSVRAESATPRQSTPIRKNGWAFGYKFGAAAALVALCVFGALYYQGRGEPVARRELPTNEIASVITREDQGKALNKLVALMILVGREKPVRQVEDLLNAPPDEVASRMAEWLQPRMQLAHRKVVAPRAKDEVKERMLYDQFFTLRRKRGIPFYGFHVRGMD